MSIKFELHFSQKIVLLTPEVHDRDFHGELPDPDTQR